MLPKEDILSSRIRERKDESVGELERLTELEIS